MKFRGVLRARGSQEVSCVLTAKIHSYCIPDTLVIESEKLG
jgi:hypothetical protein